MAQTDTFNFYVNAPANTATNTTFTLINGFQPLSQTVAIDFQTLLQSALNVLGPKMDECSNMKLPELYSEASLIIGYSNSVKNAISSLQSTIQTELQTFEATVNTSANQETIFIADISAGLLQNITVVSNSSVNTNPAIESCLTDQAFQVGTLQQMFNENVDLCVVAATTSANVTKSSMTLEISAFLELLTNSTAKYCQCVEGMIGYDYYRRTKAKACVMDEMKKLDTINILAQDITQKLKQDLSSGNLQFDQCMKDITDQVPGVLDYLNGEITNCNSNL